MRKPATIRNNARSSRGRAVAPVDDAVVRSPTDGGAGHAEVGAGWWSDDPPPPLHNTANRRD